MPHSAQRPVHATLRKTPRFRPDPTPPTLPGRTKVCRSGGFGIRVPNWRKSLELLSTTHTADSGAYARCRLVANQRGAVTIDNETPARIIAAAVDKRNETVSDRRRK